MKTEQQQHILSSFSQTLEQLAATHQLRTLKTIEAPRRPEVLLHGNNVIDFCSNDYLGFSQHPLIQEASIQAIAKYGTGTGGARLIGGTLDLHRELEAQLAAFKQTEAALVFNSGYQANVGVLSALISRHDTIFADKLNHASLVDGALLSRAKVIRYPHLDLKSLEKGLKQASSQHQKFIVTDTVFSMDGDLAPLTELFELSQRYQAWLILDEAHGTGLFGESHRSGLWENTGLGSQGNVIQMGTFSKALGSFGAYVAASQTVIDMLIQFSRSFIYSTSLPPSVIAANLKAIQLIMGDKSYTEKLWHNIRTLQTELDRTLSSPIAPVIIGHADQTLAIANALLDAGFFVQAIRPPTVPQGTARLRITLSALHTTEQIHQLTRALAGLIQL